jgi:hypothetical protein
MCEGLVKSTELSKIGLLLLLLLLVSLLFTGSVFASDELLMIELGAGGVRKRRSLFVSIQFPF